MRIQRIKVSKGYVFLRHFSAVIKERAYAFLIPNPAIQVLQDVMEHGEQKGKAGWHNISVDEHLNHAMEHIRLFGIGDHSEPHLRHAFCRLMMAVMIDEKTT